jgi:uncharacterized protein
MEISAHDEELKAHLLATDSHFRELAEQHAQLKRQVEEMESRHLLSEGDELEEQRLKKLKLHVKDQMLEILESYRHTAVH